MGGQGRAAGVEGVGVAGQVGSGGQGGRHSGLVGDLEPGLAEPLHPSPQVSGWRAAARTARTPCASRASPASTTSTRTTTGASLAPSATSVSTSPARTAPTPCSLAGPAAGLAPNHSGTCSTGGPWGPQSTWSRVEHMLATWPVGPRSRGSCHRLEGGWEGGPGLSPGCDQEGHGAWGLERTRSQPPGVEGASGLGEGALDPQPRPPGPRLYPPGSGSETKQKCTEKQDTVCSCRPGTQPQDGFKRGSGERGQVQAPAGAPGTLERARPPCHTQSSPPQYPSQAWPGAPPLMSHA